MCCACSNRCQTLQHSDIFPYNPHLFHKVLIEVRFFFRFWCFWRARFSVMLVLASFKKLSNQSQAFELPVLGENGVGFVYRSTSCDRCVTCPFSFRWPNWKLIKNFPKSIDCWNFTFSKISSIEFVWGIFSQQYFILFLPIFSEYRRNYTQSERIRLWWNLRNQRPLLHKFLTKKNATRGTYNDCCVSLHSKREILNLFHTTATSPYRHHSSRMITDLCSWQNTLMKSELHFSLVDIIYDFGAWFPNKQCYAATRSNKTAPQQRPTPNSESRTKKITTFTLIRVNLASPLIPNSTSNSPYRSINHNAYLM